MRYSGLSLSRSALCLALGLASCAAYAGLPTSALQIELRTDATVTQRRLTLADVALVSAGSAQAADAVRALVLGDAPRVGYVAQMTRQDLDRLLRARLPELGSAAEWSGARMVKIRSTERQVDSGVMVEAARAFLLRAWHTRFEQVDAQAASAVAELALPVGAVAFEPRPVDLQHFHARIPVWVDVYVNGTLSRTVVLPFNVRVGQAVYVARRDLAQGTTAAAGDFELKTADITEVADSVLPAAVVPESMHVRKALREGQIVTRSHVAPADMVLRGDVVKLLLSERGVSIETRAVAQQDAAIGQQVRVRSEQGSDAVLARVVSQGVVQADGR